MSSDEYKRGNERCYHLHDCLKKENADLNVEHLRPFRKRASLKLTKVHRKYQQEHNARKARVDNAKTRIKELDQGVGSRSWIKELDQAGSLGEQLGDLYDDIMNLKGAKRRDRTAEAAERQHAAQRPLAEVLQQAAQPSGEVAQGAGVKRPREVDIIDLTEA